VLRRGFKRGNQSGAVKDRGGISILEDERRVVAGHSRNQCQRGWERKELTIGAYMAVT
jgi:hypothetical protein